MIRTEILRVLPSQFHEQFLAEYDAAVANARRPERYRELHPCCGYGGCARRPTPN